MDILNGQTPAGNMTAYSSSSSCVQPPHAVSLEIGNGKLISEHIVPSHTNGVWSLGQLPC